MNFQLIVCACQGCSLPPYLIQPIFADDIVLNTPTTKIFQLLTLSCS